MLAGDAVEFPGVPRANQHSSLQRAMAQRPANMGADTIQGVDLVLYPAKYQVLSGSVKGMRRAAAELVEPGDDDERHCASYRSKR